MSSFLLKEKIEPVPNSRVLSDQLLSIRALLASAKTLELPLLRKAALRGYFHLNRMFFDPSKQFYSAEISGKGKFGRAANLGEVALALRMGEELSPFMSVETRTQWEKLSAPWLRALQEL